MDTIYGCYEFSSSNTPIYTRNAVFVVFGEDICEYLLDKKEWKPIVSPLTKTINDRIMEIDNGRSLIYN